MPQRHRLEPSMLARWVSAFCAYFGITTADLARLLPDNHMSTIYNLVSGRSNGSIALVIDLWEVFKRLSEEKHLELVESYRAAFFHAGGFATPEEEERATYFLDMFHRYLSVQEEARSKSEIIGQLTQEREELQKRIERLERENERLRHFSSQTQKKTPDQ